MPYDDHALAAFARNRHNAISRAELIHAVGLSPSGISRHVRRGSLHRVAASTYVYGSGYLCFRGRARIAQLCGGPGAGVHMDAALALLGCLSYEPSRIDVLTPNRRRSAAGVRFHGARATNVFTHDVFGIDCVSAERAIRGLAAVRPADRLMKTMQAVRHNHRLDLDELARITQECKHMRGHQTMIEALDAFVIGNNGSWSDIERIGWDLLLEVVDDEVPIQNQHLRINGKSVYVDMRWARSRVGVEFDGPPHLFVDAMSKDAEKDRMLRSIGDLTIHIPWKDLMRPATRARVREDVRRAIIDHRLHVASRNQSEVP